MLVSRIRLIFCRNLCYYPIWSGVG